MKQQQIIPQVSTSSYMCVCVYIYIYIYIYIYSNSNVININDIQQDTTTISNQQQQYQQHQQIITYNENISNIHKYIITSQILQHVINTSTSHNYTITNTSSLCKLHHHFTITSSLHKRHDTTMQHLDLMHVVPTRASSPQHIERKQAHRASSPLPSRIMYKYTFTEHQALTQRK